MRTASLSVKGISTVNREAAQSITVMLNGFPQSPVANMKAVLLTFGQALHGVSDDVIREVAQRYVSGAVAGQSSTFAPSVAEFAQEARRIAETRAAISDGNRRKLYVYRKPTSELLERNVTKEFAFRLIDQGVHPRGSIWCPGSLDDRPDIGDLFAPDPAWKPARPKEEISESGAYQPDEWKARIRMGFKMAVLSAGIGLGKVDDVAAANRAGLDEMMALAQQWGVPIPEELWTARVA